MDLLYKIFTLFVWPVRIEVAKRVEMRKVLDFVARFIPTGFIECSSTPLVDAALDLVKNVYDPSNPRVTARSSNPYHRSCKGNDSEWDRVEEFMKDNANVVLVLKPRDIDNFLDYGVSIWMTW